MQPDNRTWLLSCQLKLGHGIAGVCATKTGAENLAKRRTQALGELFNGRVFVDEGGKLIDSGMTVKQLLADLGVMGVHHEVIAREPADPGLIEHVQPKLVVLNS